MVCLAVRGALEENHFSAPSGYRSPRFHHILETKHITCRPTKSHMNEDISPARPDFRTANSRYNYTPPQTLLPRLARQHATPLNRRKLGQFGQFSHLIKTLPPPQKPSSASLLHLHLLILIHLKSLRHRSLLATFLVLIHRSQNPRSSRRSGSTNGCRCVGCDAVRTGCSGGGRRGFLLSLELEERFGLVGVFVEEEDGAAGRLEDTLG